MSVSQLATALGLTPGGVRQQLAQLESAGTIVHEPGPGGRGRFFYSMATTGSTNRSGSYHRFVVRLLQSIEAEEAGVVKRAASQMRRLPRTDPTDRTVAARLEAAQRALDEEGFGARIEVLGDSRFSLRLLACPVEELAEEFKDLCDAEEQCLFEWLAGLPIAREAWRLAGAGECRYVVGGAAAGG